jgi:NADH-quinone oxidoreductase subunit M
MIGVFAALDVFLFYVFWDFMLIPMYFLIGVWGYDRRIYAAIKFMLYTMAGSVLMLVAIIGLSWLHHSATGEYTFDLLKLYALDVPAHLQYWFFLAFALAFAIKVPLFPFHTWLPDAHVQAPTPGSVILAGVLLKMGGYGFVRFAFPLFPEAALHFAPLLAVLAVIAIVYGALVAMVQPDMKKLVAYSSVSHMGFVVLGIAAMNVQGCRARVPDAGARRQHGRAVRAGRHAVGPPAHAAHQRVRRAEVDDAAPDRGLPDHHAGVDRPAGLNGFIGEFLIMVGGSDGSRATWWWPAWASSSRPSTCCGCSSACSSARSPVRRTARQPDLTLREWAVVGPLCAMAVVMGVFPNVFLRSRWSRP